MALRFQNIKKKFGDLTIIRDISLDVGDDDFLVLLGPSGCGKSTLLRMIAGLEEVTSGEIHLNGKQVEHLPPSDRDMAFVFQSYALYPHMTVRRNITFPLIMREHKWWFHIPLVGYLAKRRIEAKPDIRKLVAITAETLGLTQVLDKHPRTLSGGQRQRVALGRAMVRQPAAFLMDEPLSNLDAKLRTAMRAEIGRLHHRLGGTFVYVTHDQVEAMTMGTRIALLRDGDIQQFGTPREIYERPANTYVARFIGTPPMNLIEAQFQGGNLRIGNRLLPLPETAPRGDDRKVWLGIRPDAISLTTVDAADALPARVTLVEHAGAESLLAFDPGDIRVGHDEDGQSEIMASQSGYSDIAAGDRVGLMLDIAQASYFDIDGGLRID